MLDKETVLKIRKAGKIAAQVRREGAAKLAVPGASFLETMDYCEKRIVELGGQIAWAQMAVNDVAAHFCPLEDDASVGNSEDLLKIDIGVHLDGYIADNAMTVAVGAMEKNINDPNGEYADLIKAAQNALRAAAKLVEPGRQLWELGEAQFSEAEALGFTTVKNLSGHTIEPYIVHAGVSIPSFNNGDKTELREGWQIAIEPFVTNGQGLIREKQPGTIFMQQRDGGVRSPYARKILTDLRDLNGLPFTTRWMTRKYGGGAKLGMRELLRTGIVKSYPPLVEVGKGMVAQFEHSFIVGDGKGAAQCYTRHKDDAW